jgi:hypothetical protein
MLTALLLSISFGTLAPTNASAQNYRQSIPKYYRGTWHFVKGNWKEKVKTMKIGARSIRHPNAIYKGNSFGVYRAKNWFSAAQVNRHGKRIGENFIVHKTTYKHHKAVKVVFDTAVQYYIK